MRLWFTNSVSGTNFATSTCLISFLAEQSDLNMLIRSVRLLLHLARTPPLSEALDLRNEPTKPKDADYYWIGDADPDKVRSHR